MNPIIAISMGDFNGIGPEVILKTLHQYDLKHSTPLIIGSRDVFNFYQDLYGLNMAIHEIDEHTDLKDGQINLFNIPGIKMPDIQPGTASPLSGLMSMRSVEKAIQLCLENVSDAMVTAPISKKAISDAGYNVPGHTEFLTEKTGADSNMMILATDELRVGLSTVHIPLKDVAGQISRTKLIQQIELLNQSLISDFQIAEPSIAVLGLNPHAGDDGVIGLEEIEIIAPAIADAYKQGILATGPFAADGFFGMGMHKRTDAILAMYHDQGLIPFKALSFGKGVNFTAGLPIIRTSPDHGTAFNIAGKNRADYHSFEAAYQLAESMALAKK